MEIGVYTVENTPDPCHQVMLSPHSGCVLRIEEVELADQVGLCVRHGEHHWADFLAPAPPLMLAAAAERTKTIRLSSAVTGCRPTTRCGSQ
jgi:alkanesulfonate monooxygenase SsuD/methylene tetrahydromethanopterin reductase-like flavin-dependent oxidoreductase (luciferase family)